MKTDCVRYRLIRFSNFEFAKKVGKPSDKATVWDGLQGKVRVVKKSYASGVAAGVILTPWSVGYSSIGEAVALDLAVARFKQNKRQLVPVKAGRY